MREIKFRAWDEEAEKMFYSQDTEAEYFFEFMDGKLRGFAIRPPRPSSDPMEPPEPYCDDYPVMQFTGLKDKNPEHGGGKKEVWQGDIFIINENDDEWYAEVGWDNKRARFVFKRFYSPVTDVSLLDAIGDNNCRLCGNIHENPELLK